MKEAIKTIVVTQDGEELELEIIKDGDCLEFVDTATQEPIFSGDWTNNFAPIFERALDIWPTEL